MKGFLIIPLAIILLIGFVFGGCAEPTPEPTPTPTPAPTPTPTPTPTPAPKTYEELIIKYNLTTPMTPQFDGWAAIADEIKKLTGGKQEIIFYEGGVLAKTAECYNACLNGLADVVSVVYKGHYNMWPLVSVFDLPTVHFPNTPTGLEANNEAQMTMFKEFPVFQEYWKNVHVLRFSSNVVYALHMAKEEVRVPDDLKGMRIGSAGPLGDFVQFAGGTPVNIMGPDSYLALKTGQEDGQTADWNLIGMFKIWEVLKYHLDYDLGRLHVVAMMNKDTWNRLSPEVQALFEAGMPGVGKSEYDYVLPNAYATIQDALDNGNTIYTPTPEEKSLWDAIGEKVEEKWIAEMEEAGETNAAEILARYHQLADEACKKE